MESEKEMKEEEESTRGFYIRMNQIKIERENRVKRRLTYRWVQVPKKPTHLADLAKLVWPDATSAKPPHETARGGCLPGFVT